MSSADAPLDPAEVGAFAFRVWSYKQGELVAVMIHLGDRLGLYRALADGVETTAVELAQRTQLHERWVREWLRGNAAAGLLDSSDGERFQLSAVGAAVLADEEQSLAFAAGAFTSPLGVDVVDGLAEAFRTGIGLTYDRLGPCAAHATERSLGPWARLALVPQVVPALDGVRAKLDAGCHVADVGCGAGVALTALAEAYPASRFHGFDLSRHALDRAEQRVAALGLDNVTLHAERAEQVGGHGPFDLVLTFDCLHDMTRPQAALDAIHSAMAGDGTLLIKDIRCTGSWSDDQRNPMLAMMYGFSITSCLSSAMSEPGGAGLGTLGFGTGVAEQMARAAGFRRFTVHDFDDPANLYYEVRP